MERFDKYKLDDLKTWKKLSWLTTICYGFYCLSLIFNTLLEDVSENVDAMNESNLPLYILFFVIAMHSISITLIYRVLRPAEQRVCRCFSVQSPLQRPQRQDLSGRWNNYSGFSEKTMRKRKGIPE